MVLLGAIQPPKAAIQPVAVKAEQAPPSYTNDADSSGKEGQSLMKYAGIVLVGVIVLYIFSQQNAKKNAV